MVILDGRQERVQFDKITARVSRLCYGLDMDHVDPVAITQKVISGVYGGVTTVQLDDLVSYSSQGSALDQLPPLPTNRSLSRPLKPPRT
jgi:hypothetical protein